MQRRVFSREFKHEAVKLATERGVAVAQAARDLDVAQGGPAALDPGCGGRHQVCLSRPWPGAARAAGNRSSSPRGRQAPGGACHPKKAAAYFARDAIGSSPLSRRIVPSGRWPGSAQRWASRARAFMLG